MYWYDIQFKINELWFSEENYAKYGNYHCNQHKADISHSWNTYTTVDLKKNEVQ